jgi:protein-tyrosine phosphatase
MPLQSALYRVIFVCSGNICRSPAAECVFRARAARAGLLERIAVDSAGTHGLHEGDPPDPRSVRVLLRGGYPVEGRARELRPSDFGGAGVHDLYVCMDRTHERHVLAAGAPRDRVMLLRAFDGTHARSGAATDLPDPYYGGAEGFDEMLAMIERAMDGLLAHVEAEVAARKER